MVGNYAKGYFLKGENMSKLTRKGFKSLNDLFNHLENNEDVRVYYIHDSLKVYLSKGYFELYNIVLGDSIEFHQSDIVYLNLNQFYYYSEESQ